MKKRLAPSARFEAVPLAWSIAVTMLGWLTGCGTPAAPPEQQPPSAAERRFPGNMIEVPGQTQPVPSRVAKISPAVPATVTEVLVALGDRVKAGQLLVKLNEHKALAEVHCKQTILAGAKASLATLTSGPPPSKLKMAELEARDAAAQGSLETAQARLKKYTLTAAIDGIVTSLEVHPGITADPGTSVWGEIIDLHQIDVRCELTPLQADGVTQRQRAEVIPDAHKDTTRTGRVVFVGLAADPDTGRVPVLVRLDNAGERFRCQEGVKVRLAVEPPSPPAP